jgi:hypothetical protein
MKELAFIQSDEPSWNNNYVDKLKYCSPSAYDQRDEHHVIYALFDISMDYTDWAMEDRLEIYCKNSDKGKGVLMNNLPLLIKNFDVIKVDEFKKLLEPTLDISPSTNTINLCHTNRSIK